MVTVYNWSQLAYQKINVDIVINHIVRYKAKQLGLMNVDKSITKY